MGDFEASAVTRPGKIPCRVVCGRGKLGQTDFAAEVTAAALTWYQDYFAQRYNYQKLDQVAVPGFDAGAMENVGAIFYRQNLLLMAPGATSWQAQKRIAEVIAHEIAHQWFGNLVTMKWWDDLWLNEAFATWVAFKAIDAWRPKWRIWDEYLQSKEAALEADALVNTHPVYTEVQSPAEATELFDVITYEKGCSILRMVESYLGEEVFRDGIRRYLAAFKNGNATGRDLWQKLEEASGEPMSELLQRWVTTEGFPLLSVDLAEVDGATVLRLRQRRFFASGVEESQAPAVTWPIPMTIGYDRGLGLKTLRVSLHEAEAKVRLPAGGELCFVHPNLGATGFYRTQLDDELLRRLLAHGLTSLDPASRICLIDDQWALVRSGLAHVESFVEVLRAFRDEHDYAVVRSLAGRLGYLDQRLVGDADRPRFARFVSDLFAARLAEVGFAGRAHEDEGVAARRATLIHALGDLARDPRVLDEAERCMRRELVDPAAIDANLAGVVLALAALRGDEDLLREYLRVYKERKAARLAPELQSRYLGALPYFEDEAAAASILQACLDGTIPQEQLRTILVPRLLRRGHQRETWDFVKQHFGYLRERVGVMGISRLVEATGALPFELYDDVREFFAQNPVAEAKRALQKALEAMTLREQLREREGARLGRWLAEHCG